jgi:tetratricopeptide (TPR) repeat protein/transcriptional regulator with XRE-family HTH domain
MSDHASDAPSNLRQLRLRAMMTQEELALKAGIGIRTVRDIESGRVRPQPRTLRLLAEALALSDHERSSVTGSGTLATPAPRELPRELATFAGRERQLHELLNAVDDGANVVAVHGMAGVGKTTLAVRAAHVLAPRYPDGQLFVDLLGFTDTAGPHPSPESVLARVLRSLNVDVQHLPADIDELAAVYRSTIARRRILLLLDNAATAEQLEPLLPGAPDSLVLTTSRRDLSVLPSAYSARLDPPPMREAVAMIDAAAQGRTTADEAEAIAERCGRLPRAIGRAAARLRSRPRWRAEDLLRRFDDEHRLLEELDMGHGGVAASLGASYCELDAAQQCLLRRLSLVPGDDVDVYAAAALCDTDPAHASATLESLVDMHLAESRSPGRYRLHDLVRLFAARLADLAETTEHLDAAFDRLLGVYLHFAFQAATRVRSQFSYLIEQEAATHRLELPGFSDRESAISWFQVERGNLIAAMHAAVRDGHLEPAWQLANAFSAFRMHDPDVEQHFTVNAMALDIARRLDDDAKRSRSLSDRGRLLSYAGANREAIDCLEQLVALRRRLGDDVGVATALRSIGILHRHAGRLTEALDVYRSALAITESIAHTRARANIAVNMVIPLLRLGRLEEAERHLADVERRLEADDADNVLHSEIARGTITRMQGDPTGALAIHIGCLDPCRRLDFPSSFCRVLIELGEDLLCLNRTDEAVVHLRQAVEQAEAMAYLSVERAARNALGRALTASGEVEAAIDEHRRVLRLSDSQEDRYEVARAHHGLADAFRRKGTLDAAQLHMRSAAEGYAWCGVPAEPATLCA